MKKMPPHFISDMTLALTLALQKTEAGKALTIEDIDFVLEGIEHSKKEKPNLEAVFDVLETCFSAQKKRLLDES
jgi:hypothetical protein